MLRLALRLAEVPYTLAVCWRNGRYDRGAAATHRVSVPVVSVGNLTLGGTGKTPMVQWIARWFRGHGVRVTVISRGYGAEAGATNDEALELEQNLPDVPHLENPDRVEAARLAVAEFESQLILLDDAFQHRQIERDLDLVMLDALERAEEMASHHGVRIRTIQRDLEEPEALDGLQAELIVVVRYLERSLFPALERTLTPGGILAYETFTEAQRQYGHPRNPRFLLREGELRTAFPRLEILRHEHVHEGAYLERLIARRPAHEATPS